MIEERFALGSSLLHRTDPSVKIIGATVLAIIIAISQSMAAILIGLGMGIALALLARLSPRALWPRFAAVNLFCLFLWVTLPLTGGGEAMGHIWSMAISRKGVMLALYVTIKTNAILLVLTALLATSPVHHIGRGMQRLGISTKLTLLLLTSYRYLNLIHQEFKRLQRAAELRCFDPRTNIHTYRTYSYLVGMTFVRSWERSRRVHNAMLMRGFNGTFPVLDTTTFRRRDLYFLLLFTASALVLAAVSLTW
ncbi:MAG TPA: cobalt ECF transporter T component CbiQ [Desulfobulbus sp.]|nr:cobalt ECF transporter T component CbiQ [Desulfobulbus sp.]